MRFLIVITLACLVISWQSNDQLQNLIERFKSDDLATRDTASKQLVDALVKDEINLDDLQKIAQQTDDAEVKKRVEQAIAGSELERAKKLKIMQYKEIQTQHPGEVHKLRLSPDGKYLATIGEDDQIIILDPKQLKEIRRLRSGCFIINDLQFSADSKYFVTTGDKLILWSAEAMDIIKPFEETGGITAFFPSDGRYIISCEYKLIQIWDIEKKEKLKEISLDYVCSNFFLKNGDLLVAHDATSASLHIYSIPELEKMSTVKVAEGGLLSYSLDGRYILICLFAQSGIESKLTIFDIQEDAKVIDTLTINEFIKRATFLADQDLIAIGNDRGSVTLYDTREKQFKVSFKINDGDHFANDIKFNNLSKTLLISNGRSIHSLTLDGEKIATTNSSHITGIRKMDITADGKFIATIGENSLAIHDIARDQALFFHTQTDPITNVCIDSQGKRVAISDENKKISIFDINSRKLITTFQNDKEVVKISFSSETEELYFIDDDSTLQAIELKDITKKWSIKLDRLENGPLAIMESLDKQFLYIYLPTDTNIKLLDKRNKTIENIIASLPERRLNNGLFLAINSSRSLLCYGLESINIIDIKKNTTIHRQKFAEIFKDEKIDDIAFASDNLLAALVNKDYENFRLKIIYVTNDVLNQASELELSKNYTPPEPRICLDYSGRFIAVNLGSKIKILKLIPYKYYCLDGAMKEEMKDEKPLIVFEGTTNLPDGVIVSVTLYKGRVNPGRHLDYFNVRVKDGKFRAQFSFFKKKNMPGPYVFDVYFNNYFQDHQGLQELDTIHVTKECWIGTKQDYNETDKHYREKLAAEIEEIARCVDEAHKLFQELDQQQNPDLDRWNKKAKEWEDKFSEIEKRNYHQPEFKFYELEDVADYQMEEIRGYASGLIKRMTLLLQARINPPQNQDEQRKVQEARENLPKWISNFHKYIRAIILERLNVGRPTKDDIKNKLDQIAQAYQQLTAMYKDVLAGKTQRNDLLNNLAMFEQGYKKAFMDLTALTKGTFYNFIYELTMTLGSFVTKVKEEGEDISADLEKILKEYNEKSKNLIENYQDE